MMKVKVCVIQDSPVFFDKSASIAKAESLTLKYAKEGCRLIVFPESFIPGYPRGFSFGATIGNRSEDGRDEYLKYHQNSIDFSSNEVDGLKQIAKENNLYIVLGVTEKVTNNNSLYCSMAYISPRGLMGIHRKIKPTGTERIIWAESDGSSLLAFDTEIGILGGLICWENYMPLARMSMYQKGVQMYIAPTADARPEWTSTMQHIALEGRCFVLGSNQYFTKSMYPETYQSLIKDWPEEICNGGSVIIGPNGKIIEGPLHGSSGALVATIDLAEITRSQLDFDVNGHYARPDIFKFEVVNQPDLKSDK